MLQHDKMPDETDDEAILRRIETACMIHASLGKDLSRDVRTAALLNAYGAAIQRTSSMMEEMKVGKFCARCAGLERGSCCFEQIAWEYDPPLLLANLLLGCDPPRERKIPGSCFFLGENGCRLTARYHFCVNYLCPDLRDFLGSEGCMKLLVIVGEEIATGWEIERHVRRLAPPPPGRTGYSESSGPSVCSARVRTIS
jgi:hypothetical protein